VALGSPAGQDHWRGSMTQDGLMLIVHVHANVKAALLDEFLAATLVNAQNSLDEPGVLRFDVIQDQADPAHIVLVEVYRDEDAASAHKGTPHYATWRDAVADMMAEPRASVRYTAAFPAAEKSWVSSER
jgi:(4S)-4-hydroxy-5-phosphonooxypentane-2,3-dione isomerase